MFVGHYSVAFACKTERTNPEFALEIALLAGGIATDLTRNAMPAIRKGTVIAFGIALVIVQIGERY